MRMHMWTAEALTTSAVDDCSLILQKCGSHACTASFLLAWQEEYYVEANVEKALRIDEWTAEALTTSAVDDCFFILQKCGRRSLATGSLQSVCAVLGSLNTLLAGGYRRHLDSRWKVGTLHSAHLGSCNHSHVACIFQCLSLGCPAHRGVWHSLMCRGQQPSRCQAPAAAVVCELPNLLHRQS